MWRCSGSFPRILKTLLPLAIPTTIAWEPIIRGCLIGFAICILFALPSLLRFRRLSPLRVFRAEVDVEPRTTKRDPILWLVYGLIVAGVTGFAISQTDTLTKGLVFSAALGVAVAIFAGVAKLLIVGVRKFFPHGWSFVLRQGLANLYRPNNRTLLLTLSLGLGTFLLLNLYLSREVLLAQFQSVGTKTQANIFLFDIQPDQKTDVAEIVRSAGMPIIQEAPIVTMRLAEIKGRKTVDILADPHRKIPEWELQREYRCTYREQLSDTEKITAGRWIGRVDYHPGDTVPISLDAEIAKDFEATIGDELIFDVQGVPIKTTIASLREVDWKRFQTNFFVVFPAGVLESAPTFHVLVSRVETPADSAKLQNAVVAKYPNVSAIDLTSVIQTVDSILSKVAIVIRVMSLFTVGAGIDCAGEHDLEWPLSATAGEHSAAHAGRVARANLENPVRGVFSARRFRQRDGDHPRGRRELGAGKVRFQTELRAVTLAALGHGCVGQPAHGGDRPDRKPRRREPAAVGDPARGSGVREGTLQG